jgi:hypothetical protein
MPTIDELRARHPVAEASADQWAWARSLRDGLLAQVNERQRWLVKGLAEEPSEFAERVKLAAYSPITPLVASRFSGAVWRREATREMPESLKPFADAASIDGLAVGEFAQRAAISALWYRWSVALLDRPAMPEPESVLTQADAKAARLDKPYLVLFDAPNVLDWRFDRDGKISYIRLRSPAYTREDGATVEEIREVTLAGIVTHRIVKIQGTEHLETLPIVGSSPALIAANRLPIAVFQLDPADAMVARSPLQGALLAELRCFRLLADLIYDLWIAGHPTLLCWVRDELGRVGVGANKFIKLMPGEQNLEKEVIEWLEAALPGLAHQFAALKDAAEDVWRQAGIRPIAETAAPEANSGVSLAWQFETTEAHALSSMAAAAEDFEWDALTLAALDMGIPVDDKAIAVHYPKEFSLHTPERLLTRASSARMLYGPTHPVTVELLRRAAAEMLDNVTAERWAEIETAIEAGAYEPPVPEFGGGEGEA